MLLFTTTVSSANVNIWPQSQTRTTNRNAVFFDRYHLILTFGIVQFTSGDKLRLMQKSILGFFFWSKLRGNSSEKFRKPLRFCCKLWSVPYLNAANITCRVYPGSHRKDTTLFIWRRSPTLMPFIGTTGSGQLVRDTADSRQKCVSQYRITHKL